MGGLFIKLTLKNFAHTVRNPSLDFDLISLSKSKTTEICVHVFPGSKLSKVMPCTTNYIPHTNANFFTDKLVRKTTENKSLSLCRGFLNLSMGDGGYVKALIII